MRTILISLAILLAVYTTFILILYLKGRREDARAWGGLIPDCIILFKRLLSEPAVPFRSKLMVYLLIAYLAMPIDIVPDFIPVAGQLDDVIIVTLVLRDILKRSGEGTIRSHWPGPEKSLKLLLKLSAGRT